MNFYKTAHSLFLLLEKEAKFIFDEVCMEAFTRIKDKLSSAPVIIVADWSKPFELMYDASGVALGAVLGL